jgi:hypothetical protein
MIQNFKFHPAILPVSNSGERELISGIVKVRAAADSVFPICFQAKDWEA